MVNNFMDILYCHGTLNTQKMCLDSVNYKIIN